MNFSAEYNKFSIGLIEAITDNTNKIANDFLEKYRKHTEMLSQQAKNGLSILGYYGWYIPSLDHPVTFPARLADELNEGNEEYVNTEMSKMIRENYKVLCKQIIVNNPNRSRILQHAFKAHKSKKYALSVPVFLTQADGICKEITNYGLFNKENKIPKTKKYVDNLDKDEYFLSYLEPLRILLPIIYSDDYVDENMKFNRHKILHGEDYNYDNELISLKSFSLLCYINTFLHYKSSVV
ncbi:MAG: hypothetical protein GX612_04385 [Bacteroidales bacterium]|nr:hypothetical protein [Bacteroidales bacterium]